jgi:hypothetical protein
MERHDRRSSLYRPVCAMNLVCFSLEPFLSSYSQLLGTYFHIFLIPSKKKSSVLETCDLVYAQWHEDLIWYRARLLSQQNTHQAELRIKPYFFSFFETRYELICEFFRQIF